MLKCLNQLCSKKKRKRRTSHGKTFNLSMLANKRFCLPRLSLRNYQEVMCPASFHHYQVSDVATPRYCVSSSLFTTYLSLFHYLHCRWWTSSREYPYIYRCYCSYCRSFSLPNYMYCMSLLYIGQFIVYKFIILIETT